jgi:hypothetical protein
MSATPVELIDESSHEEEEDEISLDEKEAILFGVSPQKIALDPMNEMDTLSTPLKAEYGSFSPTEKIKMFADDFRSKIAEQFREGFVLVFDSSTPRYEVCIEGDKLCAHERPRPWITYGISCLDKLQGDPPKLKKKDADNLLRKLRAPGVRYAIQRAPDGRHIYVIVTVSRERAEWYMDKLDMQVEIDAEATVRYARKKLRSFALAQHTYIPEIDDNDPEVYLNTETKTPMKRIGSEEVALLDMNLWYHIHIPYDSNVPKKIYKKSSMAARVSEAELAKWPDGGILNNRLFLRVVWSYLTNDKRVAGCGYKIENHLNNASHPLVTVYATNDPNVQRPGDMTNRRLRDVALDLASTFAEGWKNLGKGGQQQTIVEIRDYYGEQVAFYFAFLLHYQRWLQALVPVGTIWFFIQIGFGRIDVPGSIFVVLYFCIWATMMLENWYRLEHKLRFEWGMMNIKKTETPRPGFKGRLSYSSTTGQLIETYSSLMWYYLRIIFSAGWICVCLGCVIASVIGIWTLQRRPSFRDNPLMSVVLGFINSVQITLFNMMYTRIAIWLNQREGHRLESEYYNHLVVKRVLFYIVNSFNSIVYLAFYKNFHSNKERLQAVRLQLVTLFVSMIFIQNVTEVAVPMAVNWFFGKVEDHNETKRNAFHPHSHEDGHGHSHMAEPTSTVTVSVADLSADVIAEAEMDIATVADDTGAEARSASSASSSSSSSESGAFEDMKRSTGDFQPPGMESTKTEIQLTVDDEIWTDARQQFGLPEAPSVLDNTAEIVIQFGYVTLFCVVFPLMPMLAIINNFVEFRLDYYTLSTSRRCVPYPAMGIGVWKPVLSTFCTIAVVTNLVLICFRGHFSKVYNLSRTDLFIFFFTACLTLFFLQFVMRFLIPDYTGATVRALERQAQCEKFLFLANVKKNASLSRHASALLAQHGIASPKKVTMSSIDEDDSGDELDNLSDRELEEI